MKSNKFFTGLLMAALAMAGLAACSSDEPLTNGTNKNGPKENDGEGVYMGLTIKMPSGNGTRSQTINPDPNDPNNPGNSSDGVEVGAEDENFVSSVYVVLASKSDNSFIVASPVINNLVTIPAANSYKTTAKIQKSNLNDYYTSTDFDPEVNVFVFCNPTNDLSNMLEDCEVGDKAWFNKTCEVIQSNVNTQEPIQIWQPNQFLMNNYRIATRTLPASINDWDSYKTENSAFDLSGVNFSGQDTEIDNSANIGRGAIEVERSVARFDFRDASPTTTPANTYDVVKNKEGNTLVQIELNRIMLANEAKEFYYLPRVSDNGLPSGANFKICGLETRSNCVVGPYATFFQNTIKKDFSNYFNYTFFDDAAPEDSGMDYYYDGNTWFNSKISTVLANRTDLYGGPNEYHVWRYCTENVIPMGTANQKKGITTTVIFKGRMVATDECVNGENADENTKEMYKYINNEGDILKGVATQDPTLYSIYGALYFKWANVVKAAIAASVRMDDNNNVKTYETVDENGNKQIHIEYINRADPLYVAVFGDGSIGDFEWGTDADGNPIVYHDNPADLPVDQKSANVKVKAYLANPNNAAIVSAMRKAVTGAGFTIYQSSTDGNTKGYYCYYYYYNRHNDNGLNGTMGRMEFAVVRNNVYKLAVTDIKSLGHPRLPENDPDSPEPDDPDESDDIYLTVTCQVLPWTVRVNDIVFQ